MSAGVAQSGQSARTLIARPPVQIRPPAPSYYKWLPGARTPDSRNRQPREGCADYTLDG